MRLKIVSQSRVLVIEKWGKFDRLGESGINFIKIGEKVVNAIDLRTRTLDTPKQSVITKDNVSMTIDAVVYFHVTDPYKATYKVNDYIKAMTYLVQTTLRNEIARMDMEKALSDKEQINKSLELALDQATDDWGLKVERVEIMDMDPPDEIRRAMIRQMEAERERRARVLEAEGLKEAGIMKAKGEKESAILRAEAEKETTRLRAEAVELTANAEANKLKILKEAQVDENVLVMKHIEALTEMAKSSNKVFVPYDSRGLVSDISVMSSMIKGNMGDE